MSAMTMGMAARPTKAPHTACAGFNTTCFSFRQPFSFYAQISLWLSNASSECCTKTSLIHISPQVQDLDQEPRPPPLVALTERASVPQPTPQAVEGSLVVIPLPLALHLVSAGSVTVPTMPTLVEACSVLPASLPSELRITREAACLEAALVALLLVKPPKTTARLPAPLVTPWVLLWVLTPLNVKVPAAPPSKFFRRKILLLVLLPITIRLLVLCNPIRISPSK